MQNVDVMGSEHIVRMRRVEETEAYAESVTDNGDVIGCERLVGKKGEMIQGPV